MVVRLVLPLVRIAELYMVSPFTATSHSQYSSAVAFASMFSQSSSSMMMSISIISSVSKSSLSYSIAIPPSPARAVSSPEQAAAPRQRQTARIMTAAMSLPLCFQTLMAALRQARYSPL